MTEANNVVVIDSNRNIKSENGKAEPEEENKSTKKSTIDLKTIIIIVLCVLLVVAVALAIYFGVKDDDKYHDYDFKYWTKDAKPIQTLKQFVKDIANKGNKETYVPIDERVAVFDMDGTLIGEKAPTYLEWVFYKAFIEDHPDIDDHANHQNIVDRIDTYTADNNADVGNLDKDQLIYHAKAFKGWTLNQTAEYIDKFVEKDVPGFKNLKYKGLFFKPMVEIVNFLQKNSFKVIVVTGSERFWVRHYVHKYLPTDEKLPKDNFIGADIELIASGEKDKAEYNPDEHAIDYWKYLYQKQDSMIRSGLYLDENMYMGKVRRIIREIGIQPILAFGNSNGDVAMMNYAKFGNPYKSLAFMLVADDTKREYGVDDAEEKRLKTKWTDEEHGYELVSMRDDWTTIYGDNVTITK